ncbi:TonB-dependent receptor [Granulicella tundricola]|nr:TonB-dependent receptor [Granulicella tundricola]
MHSFRRSELYAATLAFSRLLQALGVLTALLLASPPDSAQSPVDGAIQGVVLDSRGAAVPHAALVLRNTDTGATRLGSTQSDGSFLLPHLPPGHYTLRITATEFVEAREIDLTVSLGETADLRTTLHLANLTPTAQTTDDTLARLSPALESTLTDSDLAQLPANAHRWQDLALTTSGAAPDQDDDGLFSANGLPSTQNSVLLDGASQNQSFSSVPAGSGSDAAPDPEADSDSAELATGPSHGLSRGRHAGIAYSFSQSAVREFRVTTQTYSALTGSAAGAILTSVSKSGGAIPHGSVFFLLRSQALAAANPLSLATTYNNGVATTQTIKPHDLRESYGGTMGGPIPHTAGMFGFYSFDQQRRGFPAISSPADPNFYTLTPTQLALLANRGVTRAASTAALTYLASITGSTPRRADQTLNFARLDWHATPHEEFGLQYNRVRWNSPAGLTDAPVVAVGRASLGNASGSLDAILARVTSTLSTRWINQFRLQYARDKQFETPQPNLPQEPGIGPGGQAPEVNIGPNGLLFGTPASLSQQAYPDERKLEAGDILSLQLGHHLLELGGSVSAVHDRVATLANAAGTFRYDSTRTTANAGGLVDFITDQTFNVNAYPNGGCPSINAAIHLFCFTSFSQSFGEQLAAFSTSEWAGFAQDTWRIRRNLNLTLGARYEYILLPIPTTPNSALDALFGTRAATSIFPEDRNNIGPRAGIAYEPFGNGHGTIRLGYGAYYGRLPGATIRSALADTALTNSTTRIRITPSAVTACPQVANQGFGYPCAFLTRPPAIVSSTTSAMMFDRHFRLPVVQQASLSLEGSLGRHASLSATYILNIDHQLQSSTDLNIAPSTSAAEFQLQGGTASPGVLSGETFVVPQYTARVTPTFGPVTDILSTANASYNALAVTAQMRGWHGLSARGSYTWSRAIDYGANLSATPRTNNQLDPFTNGYDKGLSALNYPQILRIVAVYAPRIHIQKRTTRTFLDHWELAPILLARSGRPYSYQLYGGPSLSGGHQSINGSGGALYLPTVGRNTLRLPSAINADLRISRAFTPGGHIRSEPLKLRLSAEIFNLPNRTNLSSVETRAFLVGTKTAGITPLVFQDAAAIAAEGLNTQPFGTPTAASTSLARERQIQLSLHLEF